MKIQGNNAEKIATTLLIFSFLIVFYILIGMAFNSLTHSNIEDLFKDGMTFAATCLAPIVAILLVNEWRIQRLTIKFETDAEKIVKSLISLHSDITILDAEINNIYFYDSENSNRAKFYDEENYNKLENLEFRINELLHRVFELKTDASISFSITDETTEFSVALNAMIKEMIIFLKLMDIYLKNRMGKFDNAPPVVKEFYVNSLTKYREASINWFRKSFDKIEDIIQCLKRTKSQ